MPRRPTSFALLALLAAAIAAAPALARQAQPTPRQIRAAVASAERSRDLWATVNVCDTKRAADMMGVRGQMPAIGFKTGLSMEIRLEYYNFKQQRWTPVPGVSQLIRLGSFSSGLDQDGFSFLLTPSLYRGAVTFKWTLSGKVIGSASRRTVRNLRHVDGGDPPGYSHARCQVR
jgi:hypothetical protein